MTVISALSAERVYSIFWKQLVYVCVCEREDFLISSQISFALLINQSCSITVGSVWPYVILILAQSISWKLAVNNVNSWNMGKKILFLKSFPSIIIYKQLFFFSIYTGFTHSTYVTNEAYFMEAIQYSTNFFLFCFPQKKRKSCGEVYPLNTLFCNFFCTEK